MIVVVVVILSLLGPHPRHHAFFFAPVLTLRNSLELFSSLVTVVGWCFGT